MLIEWVTKSDYVKTTATITVEKQSSFPGKPLPSPWEVKQRKEMETSLDKLQGGTRQNCKDWNNGFSGSLHHCERCNTDEHKQTRTQQKPIKTISTPEQVLKSIHDAAMTKEKTVER